MKCFNGYITFYLE